GIDFDAIDPAEAGRRIAARQPAVDLVAMLDEWTFLRRRDGHDAAAHRLVEIAQAADPDPWRMHLREAPERKDLEELRRLADSIDLDTAPALSAQRLAYGVCQLGDRSRGIALFREIQRRHPDDFWITVDLAKNLEEVQPRPSVEILRLLSAAVALRPGNAM